MKDFDRVNIFISTGPLMNIYRGMISGIDFRKLLEVIYYDHKLLNMLEKNKKRFKNGKVYIWGIPVPSKDRGYRKLKRPFESIKQGDIVIIKRMKTERIQRYLNDAFLKEISEILRKEYDLKLSLSEIEESIRTRIIIVIGRVLSKYPENYMEDVNMIEKFRSCAKLSKMLWGSTTFSNLIFFDTRWILIGSPLPDEEIFEVLGYDVQKNSVGKIADALRSALLRCRVRDPTNFIQLLRKYKFYGKEPSLDIILEALEVSYFKNLRRNPLHFYQTLDELLPNVNKYLEEHGYRKISLKELEEKVDILHEKYWLAGFYRHPKASGLPIIVEFTKRIKTSNEEDDEHH